MATRAKPKSTAFLPVPMAPPQPEQKQLGFVDRVTETQIIGWAIDLQSMGEPARLVVSIDGLSVDTLLCDQRRNDLAGSGLPSVRAGFIYDIPHGTFDGAQHRISFRFYSGTPVLFTNRLGQSVAEWHFANSKRAVFEGFVDGLTDGGAINGWLFRTDTETGGRMGANRLLVMIDGALTGEIMADQFRPDVGGAHRCDPYCGFSYIPPAKYRSGKTCRFRFLVLHDRTELQNSPIDATFLPNAARGALHDLLDVAEKLATQTWSLKQRLRTLIQTDELSLQQYGAWAAGYFPKLRARVRAEGVVEAPLVSVICPTYRPALHHFVAAVQSVQAQSYQNWELIIVDDGSKDAALSACIADFCRQDARIKSVAKARNNGISAATNAGIAASSGAFVAFFDHDDLLVDVALEAMMTAAVLTGARVLYCDEDKIDERGNLSDPHLKPDWNVRLLLGNNYVCHLLVVERRILLTVGKLNSKYDGAQDHDLVLRLAETLAPGEVHHVPDILYHWRKAPGSTALATTEKTYTGEAGIACVGDHLRRRGHDPRVSQIGAMTCYAVDWQERAEPSVCIIIPYKDQIEVTQRCLRAILSLTAYRNFDIVLVDNWSMSEAARGFAADVSNIAQVRVLRVPEAFNFSRLNNLAARESAAEFYMFMNNDLFVTERNWLRVLVDEALCNERVGAVGGKFVYPDNTVQHGGVILGVGGVAEHAHRGLKRDEPGYMARALMAQEMSAVTGAGMLCNAAAFREVDGFDESDLMVAFNDVDLCLKLRRAGYRIIWTPQFVAEHHESISRGDDNDPVHQARFFHENQTMMERWGPWIAEDPHYNRNFSRRSGIFRTLAGEAEGRE